jgi:hypothetical protein
MQKHTLEPLNPDFGVCMNTYEKENKDALLTRLYMQNWECILLWKQHFCWDNQISFFVPSQKNAC